jgi:serine/threonine-protein kinase
VARASIPPRGGPAIDRVGPYKLLEKLQDGVLGALWAALHEGGEDPTSIVALRWMPYDDTVTPEVGGGVVDAARAAPWLQHELVVPIEDVEVTDDGVGVVSEYMEGESLRGLLWSANLKRKPLPVAVALRIALDLLESLAFIHEQGEGAVGASGIHADNILLCLDGRARLLEPSVTWYASVERPWSHDPRLVCYCAPEFLASETIDERADVFAVGIVLWEILRNRPLFGGGGYDNVVRAVRGGRIARVDTMRARSAEKVSSALADVVERALNRSPSMRFASARDMAAAIHETQELPATPDEVTDFLDAFAADALAKQRRTVARAVAKAAKQPKKSQKPTAADPDSEGQPDFDDLFGVSSPPGPVGNEARAKKPSAEEDPVSEEAETVERDLPGDEEVDDQAATRKVSKRDLADLPPDVASALRGDDAAAKPAPKPGVVLKPGKGKTGEGKKADQDVPEPEESLAGSMDDLGGLEAERVAEDAADEARRAASEDVREPAESLAGSMDALDDLEAERAGEEKKADKKSKPPPPPKHSKPPPAGKKPSRPLPPPKHSKPPPGGKKPSEPPPPPKHSKPPPPKHSKPPPAGDDLSEPPPKPSTPPPGDEPREPPAGLAGADGVEPVEALEALEPADEVEAAAAGEPLVEDPAVTGSLRPEPIEPIDAEALEDDLPRSRRRQEVQSKARPVVFVVVCLLLGGALAVVAWPYVAGDASDETAAGESTSRATASSAAPAESAEPDAAADAGAAGAGGARAEDAGKGGAGGAAAAGGAGGADAGADEEDAAPPPKRWRPPPGWRPDIYE